jgi:RimJ/RimL family protein N-acetyltransferase
VAVIHPGNERSLHLIARLGFTDAGWREAYGKHLASSRSRGRVQGSPDSFVIPPRKR